MSIHFPLIRIVFIIVVDDHFIVVIVTQFVTVRRRFTFNRIISGAAGQWLFLVRRIAAQETSTRRTLIVRVRSQSVSIDGHCIWGSRAYWRCNETGLLFGRRIAFKNNRCQFVKLLGRNTTTHYMCLQQKHRILTFFNSAGSLWSIISDTFVCKYVKARKASCLAISSYSSRRIKNLQWRKICWRLGLRRIVKEHRLIVKQLT